MHYFTWSPLLLLVLGLCFRQELVAAKAHNKRQTSSICERLSTRRALEEGRSRNENLLEAVNDFQQFGHFEWEISKELIVVYKRNTVFAPFALKVVLASLYEGANGTTAYEIRDALRLSNTSLEVVRRSVKELLNSILPTEKENEIKMKSVIFIDEHSELKSTYLCKIRQFYNSDLKKVDFQDAEAQIHKWFNHVTGGNNRQHNIELEKNSSAVMVVLNTVNFRELWEIPFPAVKTADRTFYLNDKADVKVAMMNSIDHYYYTEIAELDAKMIKLPYLGGKFAMYVILPHSTTGLDTLVAFLKPVDPLSLYMKDMQLTAVNLTMPRFEFSYTASLRPTLEKLGVRTMFSSLADLSDISNSDEGFVVSDILQETRVSVSEIGSAYANTAPEMDKFGGEEKTVAFNANHPFLFFIQEEVLGITMIVGKVTNPDESQI